MKPIIIFALLLLIPSIVLAVPDLKGLSFTTLNQSQLDNIISCTDNTFSRECTLIGGHKVLQVLGDKYYNGIEYVTIDTGLEDNNDSYKTKNTPYQANFRKTSTNANDDGLNFCIRDFCFTYQLADISYRDYDNGKDHIANLRNIDLTILGDSAEYVDIFDNITLQYIPSATGIKENFIITELPKEPKKSMDINNTTLDFGGYIKHNTLDIYLNGWPIGDADLITSEELEFRFLGETLFYMPKPIATDAAGATTDLEYEIRHQGGKTWIYVRVPYLWINDSARVFPIIVDPSLTLSGTSTTLNGTVSYDTVEITSGGYITIGGNGILNLTANIVYIDGTSYINCAGANEGYSGASGSYAGFSCGGGLSVGGGGGGHGANGGEGGGISCSMLTPDERYGGGGGGTVGSANDTTYYRGSYGGSGTTNGGAAQGGGAGGCALRIYANDRITIAGNIYMGGGGGGSGGASGGATESSGGGGGGSGGTIYLLANILNLTGADLYANGGNGGAGDIESDIDNLAGGGGGGAGGRIKLVYGTTLTNTSMTYTVAGGAYGGCADGGAGEYGQSCIGGAAGSTGTYYTATEYFNQLPSITNVSTIPETVYAGLNNVYITANVTDADNDTITGVYFTVSNPENTIIVNNNVGSNYCYQEFANESTSCGGLNTGTYTNPGSWSDGNWGTSSGTGTYFVNYTKPTTALNTSLWQTRIFPPTGYANNTIPINCWNQAVLQFRIQSYSYIDMFQTFVVNTSCYDGSGWTIISSTSLDENPVNFYEEAMWWNGTGPWTSTPFNISNTTQSVGVWNYNITAITNSTVSNISIYSGTFNILNPTPPPNVTNTLNRALYNVTYPYPYRAYTNNPFIFLNFTTTDTNYSYTIYELTTPTNKYYTNTTNQSYNWTGLSDGIYDYSLYIYSGNDSGKYNPAPIGFEGQQAGAGTSHGATTLGYGIKVQINTPIKLINITKISTCTATRVRVYDVAALSYIGTAYYSGNTATFTTPLALTSGKIYRIEGDNSGASYNGYYGVWADTGTYNDITYLSGSINLADNANSQDIVRLDYVQNYPTLTIDQTAPTATFTTGTTPNGSYIDGPKSIFVNITPTDTYLTNTTIRLYDSMGGVVGNYTTYNSPSIIGNSAIYNGFSNPELAFDNNISTAATFTGESPSSAMDHKYLSKTLNKTYVQKINISYYVTQGLQSGTQNTTGDIEILNATGWVPILSVWSCYENVCTQNTSKEVVVNQLVDGVRLHATNYDANSVYIATTMYIYEIAVTSYNNSYNFTNLPNGVYYYNATAIDLAGNIGYSPTWQSVVIGNFTLPNYTVTVKYPTGTLTNDTTYYIIGNTTDQYFNQWTFNFSGAVFTSTDTNYRRDFTSITDGTYYTTITATDLALNQYIWETNHTVDTTGPIVTFSPDSMQNNSFSNGYIYINLTINDTHLNNSIIYLYNSSGILINSTNLTSYNFTGLSSGVYYFNATAYDLVGLVGNSETSMATIINNFTNTSYNVTFPYPNNAIINSNILTYGHNTTDPYYNHTIYTITNLSASTNASTLLNGLISYYKLDEASGNATSVTGRYNLTQKGTVPSTTGKINTARGTFSIANALYNTGVDFVAYNKNLSVSTWAKFDSISPSYQPIWTAMYDNTYLVMELGWYDSTHASHNRSLCWGVWEHGLPARQVCTANGTILDPNHWYHLVGIFDASANIMSFYIDGVYIGNNTYTDGSTLATPYMGVGTLIGVPSATVNAAANQTIIDETGVWNRTITPTEINTLYSALPYNWTILPYYANSTTTNTSYTFILPDGRYYYDLTVYDKAGNFGYYDPNITIDTTPPSIVFGAKTPTNNTILNNTNIFAINVTVSDLNLNYTTINIYNNTGQILYTNFTTNTTLYIVPALSDGIYYYNATAYDSANNTNSTETRTITINYAKNTTITAYDVHNQTISYNASFTTVLNSTIVNDGAQAFSNPGNAFDNNISSYAYMTVTSTTATSQIGKIFNTPRFVGLINYTWQAQINCNTACYFNISLETYNGTAWNQSTLLYAIGPFNTYTDTGIINGNYTLLDTVQGVRLRYLSSTPTSLIKQFYAYELNTGELSANNYTYGFTDRTNSIEVPHGQYNVNISAPGYANTCTYNNWTPIEGYTFPDCQFYQSRVNITAYNNYSNILISNYTINYNSSAYNNTVTANGTNTILDLLSTPYTLTFTHPSYFTKTTTLTPVNATQTFNTSMSQSAITFVFRHAFDNSIITNQNITINDTTYNKTYTANGTLVFDPSAGIHNLTFTSNRYSPQTYNLNVTALQTNTITIYMYPILNVSIYEEKLSMMTLTYFNFSHPNATRWTVYCLDNAGEEIGTQQQIIPRNTTGAYLINATCIYKRLRIDLEYTNLDGTIYPYYRTVIFPATSTQFDFKLFLPDLSLGYAILETFLKPYDIFGVYTIEANTQVVVTKLMPTGTETITSDYEDAEGKITAYLIQGDQYIISIYADGAPVRVLGPYYANAEGTKILRLFDVALSVSQTAPATTSGTSTTLYNTSDENVTLVVLHYKDAQNWTTSLTMSVYNTSCEQAAYSNLIMTQTIPFSQIETYINGSNNVTLGSRTNYDAYMTLNYQGTRYANSPSDNLICTMTNATYSDGTSNIVTQNVVIDSFIMIPGQFENKWTFPWIIMLLLVVIALGLNARTVNIGSLILVLLAGILEGWNWFVTGDVAPGVRAGIPMAIALLIAIFMVIKAQTNKV